MMKELYFIAIVIRGKLSEEITALKMLMAKEYRSKTALRSPPHITLHMPFRKKTENEAFIIKKLDGLSSDHVQFEVEANGFGCFAPRVIFIDVLLNSVLLNLQNSIAKFGKNILKETNANYKNRPFHPHITLAFRDLTKSNFSRAWNSMKDREFKAILNVDSVCLLRHTGKVWEVIHAAPLKLPGEPRETTSNI